MKLVLFGLFWFFTVTATAESTKLLGLKLWKAVEKQQNLSYSSLDNLRTKLPENSPERTALMNEAEFKRYQIIVRNIFIDRVEKEFTRKEIINLTKIYSRPEMAKFRLFSIDFWDQKALLEIIKSNPPQEKNSTKK